MALLCHAVALGKKQITSVAVRDSGVALCHGVPPSRSFTCAIFFSRGFDYVPRSLLLNRTKTLATRAMADRESSVALCHGVTLKKRIGGGPRERSHSVPQGGVKKKRERSVADRESSVALCHGVVKKEKGKKKRSVVDRERGVSLSLDSV